MPDESKLDGLSTGQTGEPLSQQILRKYRRADQPAEEITKSGLPQRILGEPDGTSPVTTEDTVPNTLSIENAKEAEAQPEDTAHEGTTGSGILELGPYTHAHERALDAALTGLIQSGLHPELAEQVARLNNADDVLDETRVAMKRRMVAEAGQPSGDK